MIHARQSAGGAEKAQPRSRSRSVAAALALVVAASGCDEGGTIRPGDLRFGQLGRISVTVEAPLRLGDGRLTEQLEWTSTGDWILEEAVSYKGLEGDRTVTRSSRSAAELSLAYASIVEQLNDIEALSLFVDELSPELIPECRPTQSRITFTMRDDARREAVTWIRCASGSLSNLTPEGAGPDPAASRVALATLLTKEATLGVRWSATYLGSVPFGTLDRGSGSRSPLTAPATFIDVGGFTSFWSRHAPGRAPPSVDFGQDMVVVGIVGPRREAGDSLEIRRILQVEGGTVTEIFERVPGDFCSPASLTHVPFHIVVAPRTPIPHRFADTRVELVTCGG